MKIIEKNDDLKDILRAEMNEAGQWCIEINRITYTKENNHEQDFKWAATSLVPVTVTSLRH